MQFSWPDIKDQLSKFYPIKDTSWERVLPISQIIEVGQNEKQNRILQNHSRYEIFVLQGILRTFSTSKEKEYTSNFYCESNFLIPAFARRAALLEIEPLEDSTVMIIEEESFTSLRYEYSDLRKLGNKVIENELFVKSKKEVLMATMNLETLYDFFLESFPDLSNRIPQKHIASYLGVDPVSLSRLRNRIMRR